MSGLIVAVGSDWSYGGAILTFAFPMILFIAVGTALWVLYTKPHMVPGHRYQQEERAITGTGAVTPPSAPAGGGQSAAPGGQDS